MTNREGRGNPRLSLLRPGPYVLLLLQFTNLSQRNLRLQRNAGHCARSFNPIPCYLAEQRKVCGIAQHRKSCTVLNQADVGPDCISSKGVSSLIGDNCISAAHNPIFKEHSATPTSEW